jgi:hypothetical protein
LNLNAPFSEVGIDGFVVDQFAEDGDRFAGGLAERKRDGVAHAETHSQMFGADDFHDISP